MINNISTTKYKIIETGTVLIPDGEELQIQIENLIFSFKFIIDNDEPTTRYSCNATSNTNATITLYNMQKTTNATNTNLFKLGELGGKDLFVKFDITSINTNGDKCDYIFIYTFYLLK